MRKQHHLITLFFTLILFGNGAAQALNQPANWPNASWTVSGTFDPAAVIGDPTTTANFGYDDDAAGNTSFTDEIIAESPVIDLTAAFSAGETFIIVDLNYVFYELNAPDEFLTLEYWDGSNWEALDILPGNSETFAYQTCSVTQNFVSAGLDISGFSGSQLSGFRYRIHYDDGGGWNFGFCCESPTIFSSPPVSPPDCASNPTPADGGTVMDCNFTLFWDPATTGEPATSYQVFGGGFPDPSLLTLIGTTDTDSLNVVATNANDTIYWQVIPQNAGGPAVGCPVWFFVTGSSVPTEDVCTGAIEIPVSPLSCNTITTGNNCRATDSDLDTPAPPAATCSNYSGGDIWFKFVVPASGSAVISGSTSNCCSFLWYEVYSGPDCSTLTSIACSNTGGNDPSTFETPLAGLTPGDTIWIRAWDSFNDDGPGDFNFCVFEPICLPPGFNTNLVNIDCETSSTFSVDVEITSLGTGSSADITNDGGAPARIKVDTGTYTIGPFALGDTVTISVADNGDPACVDSVVVAIPDSCPPANDICVDAIPLTVDAGFCDGTNTNGDNTNATESDVGSCFIGGANDVWFVFVAPASGVVTISTDFTGGTNTDTEVALWDACGGNEIACDQDGGTTVNFNSIIENAVVTPGNTYYISVSGWNGSEGTFCIEVTSVIQPPNDNLCDATALVVGDPEQSFTNSGATEEPDEPEASCWFGTGTNETVWFAFVAPSSGEVVITTDFPNTELHDTHIGLYALSGSCTDLTGLTELGCDEDGGFADPFGYTSIIYASGLTPSETYYIQVDGYFDAAGTFTIQVREGCSVVTTIQDNVTGSLRDVLGSCNTNFVTFHDTLANDTLILESPLTIALDITIQANPADDIHVSSNSTRAIIISGGTNVTIEGLNIIGGSASAGSALDVNTSATATIKDVNVFSNGTATPVRNNGTLNVQGDSNVNQ